MQALGPLDMTSSQCGGPYTFRTILGWCIIGPIEYRMGSHHTISCNQVRVIEAGIGGNSITKTLFETQTEANDAEIKEMWQSMYPLDVVERCCSIM